MNRGIFAIAYLTSGLFFSVQAAVSDEQAKALGNTLTPIGAEKTGNSDLSIPEWQGGILSLPSGYKLGDHHPDPFAADQVLYTIDSGNYLNYKKILSDGQCALFKTYPNTFKMRVFPTHRSASYPDYIYQGSLLNATRAKLIDSGNGFYGAGAGVPFPIPHNGLEAIWNHIVRFRGVDVIRNAGQAAPMPSGDYTYIEMKEEVKFLSQAEGITPQLLSETNMIVKFKQI